MGWGNGIKEGLTSQPDRCDYFNAILAFVEQLGQIAQRVVRQPLELRQAALVDEITLLNQRMPDGLYLPLWHDDRYCYHSIVRVPPEDSKVLQYFILSLSSLSFSLPYILFLFFIRVFVCWLVGCLH